MSPPLPGDQDMADDSCPTDAAPRERLGTPERRRIEAAFAKGIPEEMAEPGAAPSCNRDGAFCEEHDPKLTLTRTRTIMGGAPHRDVRGVRREPA